MRLKTAIEDECKKLISRYHHAHANQRSLSKRFTRATGVKSKATVREPAHWKVAHWFNPFKVRKRAAIIAEGVEHKVAAEQYKPYPALVIPIDKPGGGKRQISVSPTADAALASAYYNAILRRNQSRLSPFSYAYRKDIGVHDAIERLWLESNLATHYFLVEFDFSKYFDTIGHSYLLKALRKHFRLTRSEIIVVSAVLRTRRAFGYEAYYRGDFRACSRGIPQGNSLSLFLANVACHDLDLELTRSGVLFARYADDIVVLCESRREAENARDCILSHCSRTGLAINFDKSAGITEWGPQGLKDGSSTRATFDFLGHRFSYRLVSRRGSPVKHTVRRLAIRPATESRIRAKLGRIIFSHLLRYPEQGLFKSTRIDSRLKIDWDVVTCINDLRGYIYGGLPEDEIKGALAFRTRRVHRPQGVLAFFPQINDIEQLRQLDGWLLNALQSAIKARQQLLQDRHRVTLYPFLSSRKLLQATWYDSKRAGIPNDVRLPSLVRAWKYGRRALNSIGLTDFPSRRGRFGEEDLYD